MAYVRVQYPLIQCFDDNGLLAVGYEIHTYNAGLTSLQTTYSERTLTTPNLNPVILNARGEAEIYTAVPLKLVFTIPSGDPNNPIWTVDYVAEQQSYYLTGKATPVTTYNNYIVDVVPPPAALVDNMMVVWVPDIDNADTLGTTVHGGTGTKDDLNFFGPYRGTLDGSKFRVEITTANDPDKIKWSKDFGTETTDVEITGDEQLLIEGMSFKFQETSGHVVGDNWTITVHTPVTLNLNSLGAKIVLKNYGGKLVALSGDDIKAGMPAICVYSETNNCWELVNTADPVLELLEPSRPRKYLYDDFTLTDAYHGWELCFLHASGQKTLTLAPAANFYDKYFYVSNYGTAGTVNIVSNSSGELIYGHRKVSGSTSYFVPSQTGATVQLQSNGVNWHVLTETPNLKTTYRPTSTYSLLTDDLNRHIDFLNTSGSADLTLPTAATFKNMYVHVSAGGTYDVRLLASGSEVICGPRSPNGSSSYWIYSSNGDSILLHSNGTSWRILSETYKYTAPAADLVSLNCRVFVSSDWYTKSTDVKSLIVECYGGGGGGYCCSGTSIGFPGAGGGYSWTYYSDASSITYEWITVGAGGASGNYTGPWNGSDGGTSSFGSHNWVNGGQGGFAYSYLSLALPTGGYGTGGYIVRGGYPQISVNYNDVGDISSVGFVGGGKGAGPLGGHGGPTGFSYTGFDGQWVGGGGGNAVYGPGGGYYNGGAGAAGMVIVTEIR